MVIGFDISQTGSQKAGCGYFADAIIQALTRLDDKNRYILYPYFGTTFWDPDAEHRTRRIDLPHVSRKRIGRDYSTSMAFWSQLPQDAEQRLGNPDIIHCNNYSCPRGINQARLVYTLYDLNFLEYPELTTEENRYKCFIGVFDAATNADFIVSISEYSRKTFLEVFPHYPEERIQRVPLGDRLLKKSLDESHIERVKGIEPGRFWLSVGTLEPRKNLRRLLKAFAYYIQGMDMAYPLVLAGGKGWLEDDLEAFIESLGISNMVHILGYVSDEMLIWLYHNCFCFIYPSLYEGFGLPVLEALGQGAAVITSRITSLPEVAGDAAYYVDPFDENDIAEALLALSSGSGRRETLKEKAVKQANRFSWEKSAAKVLDIYKKVMLLPKLNREQNA